MGASGLVIDRPATEPGRGAYLCSDVACWRTAARRGRLQRALRADIPRQAVERLLEMHAEGVRGSSTAEAVRSSGLKGAR